MSFELPSELLVAPLPLIGFSGLDVTRNSLHKTIWDAFCSRKADRAAVQYKLLPSNYDFPVAKPKRASYEWYHPKGILKRNWMLKHLHVLPSVVVLFQDMDWNDPQWTEKQMQCVSILQSLKSALQERNTRVCLVLSQKSAPLPPGEDVLASERAASLTNACGINSKMLFILPHTEHLVGYTVRLETAFLDMAHSYYGLMSKRIRNHRDQLTAAHITLKIRHQFKLGFVAEIRQDFSTALKHYTQSYDNLEEIRITDTNCLEIKTIAGFFNYKICRLMFKLKVPRDAINRFISHVEKYKNCIGFKDLIFEHFAWLSTQHNVFAELFCEAIKNGLPALQTQHPGIYFHKAAEYVMKRRESFLESNAIQSNNPAEIAESNESNVMSLYTEFFGVRSIKTGDPASELHIIAIIRNTEKSFNYSNSIINLLSQAMAQLKIYKCLRFRKKLAIDMADEYYKNGDFAKALTLYSLMLPEYRQEKWSTIFSDVLLKTLRCALLCASLNDYISCSIEALSLKIRCEQSERIIVLENLWKVFQSVPPVLQNHSTELRELWDNTLTNVKTEIPIDLDKLTDFLCLCATFESAELKNEEPVKLHLIVKALTDVPIKIRNFTVLLSDGSNCYKLHSNKFIRFANLFELRAHHEKSQGDYNQFEGDLKLEADHYYELLFTTESQQFHENTQLHVLRIEAQMGTDKLSATLIKCMPYTRNTFRHHNRSTDLHDNIIINPVCYIVPTFHLNTYTSLDNQPMLVNEYYSVVTTITNPFHIFLHNVGLSISVPEMLRNKVFLTSDIAPNRQKLYSTLQIDIGEMAMQASSTISYYVFSLVKTEIPLQQKISYIMDVLPHKTNKSRESGESSNESTPDNMRFMANDVCLPSNGSMPVQIEVVDENRLRKTCEIAVNISCELEFEFIGRFYTLSKKALNKIYRGENFLFRANIEVQSEKPLDILETYFICDHNLMQSTYSYKQKRHTNTYKCGEKLEDVIVLRTNAGLIDWQTMTEFERTKTARSTQQCNVFSRLQSMRRNNNLIGMKSETANISATLAAGMTKSLLGKISTNMTIISGATIGLNSSLMAASQNSNMSSSNVSDDGKSISGTEALQDDATESNVVAQKPNNINARVVYNKAMDGIQATGHCRGFLKGGMLCENTTLGIQTPQQTTFGIYCIKWRRHGCKNEENESKFVIHGLEIGEPPLNIYSSIEERMFVKMPMTFKIVLKNPTSKMLHLISTLSINHADNFICSGHKQLDVSISAFGEKELIYNLYPLSVGWQHLPDLSLEYNTQADPNKADAENILLNELVQRAIPKKVFILPPLKQHLK